MALATSGRSRGAVSTFARLGWYALSALGRNSANLLTLARLVAILPFLACLAHGDTATAFWLFFAAAVSDALDGFLAKHVTGTSFIGTVLDPVADKLLLATSLVALTLIGATPAWLLALVLVRDAGIAAGASYLQMQAHHFRIAPTKLGKACTFLQLALIGAVLAERAGQPFFGHLVPGLTWAVAVVVIASALDYLLIGWRAWRRGPGDAALAA